MKKYVKIALLVIVALIFIGTFVFLYQKSQPKASVYTILNAEITDLKKTTVATGKIEPRDEILIKQQISGIIDEVYKEAGQKIKKGEVIAKVKVIPELGQLNSAESRVRLAEINARQGETDFARMKKLFESKLISSEEYEKSEVAVKQAREALKDYHDFDIKEQEVVDTGLLLKIRDLSFAYDSTVLENLDLDVRQNEILSVVGANGSGKSSFLKCIAGLVKYQGNITKVGVVEKIGYLPQDPTTLFITDKVINELLVVENNLKTVEIEMENIGISNLRDMHPFDLSGGQKQLLALGKVLLTRPQLLLLDEPTKGIDAVSKDNLASLIRSLSKHMTIIVVSHDLEFVAKISDRVAMIFNGQMESVDSMRNFFSNNLFYTTTINKIVRNNNSEVVLLEDLGL